MELVCGFKAKYLNRLDIYALLTFAYRIITDIFGIDGSLVWWDISTGLVFHNFLKVWSRVSILGNVDTLYIGKRIKLHLPFVNLPPNTRNSACNMNSIGILIFSLSDSFRISILLIILYLYCAQFIHDIFAFFKRFVHLNSILEQ